MQLNVIQCMETDRKNIYYQLSKFYELVIDSKFGWGTKGLCTESIRAI